MKKFVLPLLVTLVLASCTHIVAKNFPGPIKKQLPSSWKGTYSVDYPEFLELMMPDDEDGKSTVEIGKDKITWHNGESVSTYTLSDSLRYTTIDNYDYIGLFNSQGQCTIFRVVEDDDYLELYGLTADDDVDEDQLSPYFRSVKEVELKDTTDVGIKLFEVYIDEDKLYNYFNSGIPAAEPILLKKTKKK